MKAPALIFAVKVVEYFLAAILIQSISNGYAAMAGFLSMADTAVWFKIFEFTLNRSKSNRCCFIAYVVGSGVGTFLGVWVGIIK